MDELLAMLREQTAALNRLAESNEALVVTIAELLQAPEDEDAPEGEGYLSAPRKST